MAAVMFDIVAAGLRSSPAFVTASVNGDHAGCVVRFHTQCGIDPIRYAVWLPTRGSTYALSRHATHIAVHVLDDSGEPVEGLLTTAGDVPAAVFDRCDWRPGPGGVPLLASCASYLVLEVVSSRVDHGGYACLIGELVHVHARGVSVQRAPIDLGITPTDLRLDPPGDRHDRGHSIGSMDAETRRLFINAAIGAGHAIELPNNG